MGLRTSLSSSLIWYQKKLGSYDQEKWEKTVEEKVLRGLADAVPKKLARVKTELIDLDIIRGSAFTKSKSKQGCFTTTYLGLMRVLLFPFFFRWWSEQTSPIIATLLSGLYFMQLSSMYIYLNVGTDLMTREEAATLDQIPTSEVLVPLVMFIILSVIQTHIAASHSLDERSRSRERVDSSVVTSTSTPPPNTRCSSRSLRPKRKNKIKKVASFVAHIDSHDSSTEIGVPVMNLEEAEVHSSKKPSDEESGLEVSEFGESSHPLADRRRRSVLAKLNLPNNRTMEVKEEESPERLPVNSEEDHVENDCDVSSLDEISPYSTVNSATATNWRRYSDLISQRLKMKEQREGSTGKRRFSVNDENMLPRSGSRPRSGTFIKGRLVRPTKRVDVESNDSEASLSPTTPNKPNTDLDWPMIHSEMTSEEEEEETHPEGSLRDAYHYPSDEEGDFICGIKEGKKGKEVVSCCIWTQNECQKVDLSVLDVSSAIIRKAAKAKHNDEYLWMAFFFSVILSLIPAVYRLQQKENLVDPNAFIGPLRESGALPFDPNASDTLPMYEPQTMDMLVEQLLMKLPIVQPSAIIDSLLTTSSSWFVRWVVIVSMVERFCFGLLFFFLLCVAERTYKERFLFAKYFCHLTSARRARRLELPHFRLNKVRHIKSWLSVRSYLRKHGPQRSVDIIVSCGFILAVIILTFLSIQLLRENDSCSSKLYCWEMVSWNLAIGIFILRLMVLGIKMNRKYKSNLSILITEQINLYLQLESKPHKKEELSLANHVIKLAADLLKQLESPFKISGFSANHYLYNITKVVVLSAFSAVLTEMLGFKLKLHKIKL